MALSLCRSRFAAWVAAYAVALHGLLVAFAPVALATAAADPFGVVCAGDASPSDSKHPANPSDHARECALACVMAAGTAAAPAERVVLHLDRIWSACTFRTDAAVPSASAARHAPSARAPPLA